MAGAMAQPRVIPEDIIHLVVDQVDAMHRWSSDFLSAHWHVSGITSDRPGQGAVLRALCLTSKAFYHAAAPCLVRCIASDDLCCSASDNARRLLDFLRRSLPKWRSHVRAIWFSVSKMATYPDAIPNPEVAVGEANVLDYLLGTIIEMVPTLDTVGLSGVLTDVYRYPRICVALLSRSTIRNLVVVDDCIPTSFIEKLCRANQAQLQRVAFCGCNIPLGAWKAFLSLPALQSLSVDSEHGVVDDDDITPIDFGLPRGLRYLQIGTERHDLFNDARHPHLQHLSISVAALSLRTLAPGDFRGALPVLRRLDIIYGCWGADRERGFVKCASDMAGLHLFHLSLPEVDGVHDEFMECVEAKGLPSLKRLTLFTRRIPSFATTRPDYSADMLTKRSRLATFL